MKTRAIRRVHDYEEQLVRIARKLPPEQVAQLVDFARFLEFRTSERFEDWLIAEAAEGGPGAGQAAWDDVLAKPESKRVLREMAREAREDYRAGRTTNLGTTEDGRLEPE